MAISRSFGGQTLLKPGAYSVSRVDNAQGIAVGENNTLMLIGEASDGNDGSQENSRMFTNVQNLIDYYVSGDIVDAALAASRPSLTPGISAPTNFIVYKTNVGFKENWDVTVAGSSAARASAGAFIQLSFPINASGETYSEAIPYTHPGQAGTSITIAEQNAILLAIDTGLEANSNFTAVFDKVLVPGDTTTLGTLVITAKKAGPQFADIDRPGAATIVAPNRPVGGRSNIIFTLDMLGTVIDATTTGGPVAGPSAFGTTFTFNTFAGIGNTVANLTNTAPVIPGTTPGASIVSLTSAFVDSFNFDPNVIIPLWSNLATGIQPTGRPDAGINRGVTTTPAAASDGITYLLAAAQLQNNLTERSSVAVRKEAQGMFGANDTNWETTYGNLNTAGINSALIQAMIQDVRIVDSLGALSWKGPHIMAALMAGTRLGSTVGEPLTFKVINANGVGHNINALTGMPLAPGTQFRPGFDFNDAINEGLTFTESVSGGNRVVVDNTRYKLDESFVFNRGSVIEAAQFVARTSRQLLERIFVGQKVSNGAALSLKNVLRNYLIQLNTDNIITSSSDAPFGFVENTFTVTINGNTASIQVEIKPVQGLDFVFIDFTLGNITQSA